MDWLADLWPVFGLLIQTPRLRLRLPREDDLSELARSARIIAGTCLTMFGLDSERDQKH